MRTLGEKQRDFPVLLAALISWAYAEGYEITLGEAYRSDEQAAINALGVAGRSNLADVAWRAGFHQFATALSNNGKNNGIAMSLHQARLAIDLNVFKGGVYLTKSEDYKPLGDKWKSLDVDARWGGDFSSPDGNHFSLTHGGVA